MSQRNKMITIISLAIIAFVVCLLPFEMVQTTYAAEKSYSNVLDDLKRDVNFNVANYPASSDDYSMEIIQIAEGSDDELFLYVYQPASSISPATSVTISQRNDNKEFQKYALTLVSKESVFYKFVVNDFKLSKAYNRYYNISAIYRPWDVEIDGPSGSDNIVDEVACAVAQLWTVHGSGDFIQYEMSYREVVTILHEWVGSLRYNDGIEWFYPAAQGKTDVHFIGFSTDHQIDRLLEVDITYLSEDRQASYSSGVLNYDTARPLDTHGNYAEIEQVYKTLYADDEEQSNPADGLWGKKHTWRNINTKDEFVAAHELSDDAKQQLDNDEFVVCFAVTEWQKVGFGTNYAINYTKISEVTILRLMFECDGEVFNLGVVSNVVTSDQKPDNPDSNDWDLSNPGDGGDPCSRFWDWLLELLRKAWNFISKVLIAIAAVVVVVLVICIVSKIVQAVKRPKVVVNMDDKDDTGGKNKRKKQNNKKRKE